MRAHTTTTDGGNEPAEGEGTRCSGERGRRNTGEKRGLRRRVTAGGGAGKGGDRVGGAGLKRGTAGAGAGWGGGRWGVD